MEAVETVSCRRRWWLEHKDDPRIRDGFRASSKRYYEKNKEAEQARKREYYQKKKLLANPPAPVPPAESPAV
jgi:hypothetical protein